MIRGIFIGLFCLTLAGCEGVIGGAEGGSRRGDDGPTANTGTSYGYASQASLLRLTKAQHQRTMEDLLGHFLGDDADAVLYEIEPAYGIIPDDPSSLDVGELVGSTFSRMSQTVGELHIRGYFDIAQTAAGMIAQDDILRPQMFGACVDTPDDDHSACIGPFIDSFGLRAIRRPLTDEEYEFFLHTVFADDGSDYQATPGALSDLLVAFFMSPSFLYRIETGGEEIEDGLYELDAYGLATRLSYHFWDSMPDEELLAAAADGSLLTEAGYAAQVERVYADERTKRTCAQFFYEWLELYKTGDPFGGVTSGNPQKMVFIEGADVTPELRAHMIDEVLEMTEYYRTAGTFDELFTSPFSFARSADLASIYEVPVWSGGEPSVEFPTPERLGLLGRGALLSAATVNTHPILRGVRIRENFMCDVLGTPPANVNQNVEDLEGLVTTRERVESLTSPSSCAGCHQFINGLGFPLEVFDSLGRHRSDEMVIDIEGGVTMLPVDAVATPFIDGPGDDRRVSGPNDLVDQLLAGGKLQRCFAQHYVRFALGLTADPAFGGDPETIEVLGDALTDGLPLGEVFKELAYLPAFKQRLRGDES